MNSLIKRKDNTIPVLLELFPGLFTGIFGIGHIVQGRVGMGAFIFVSYWFLQTINWFLTWVFGLGFVTGTLTHLFYAIAAPMNAADFKGE